MSCRAANAFVISLQRLVFTQLAISRAFISSRNRRGAVIIPSILAGQWNNICQVYLDCKTRIVKEFMPALPAKMPRATLGNRPIGVLASIRYRFDRLSSDAGFDNQYQQPQNNFSNMKWLLELAWPFWQFRLLLWQRAWHYAVYCRRWNRKSRGWCRCLGKYLYAEHAIQKCSISAKISKMSLRL